MRRHVMAGLHAAGFSDLLPGHLAVFQHPGPEGQRPGVLATRAALSKQAMNHLLTQLERGGYLTREPDPADRRTRVVRLTDRGAAALATIDRMVREVDRAWQSALSEPVYAQLSVGLARLEELLGDAPAAQEDDY